MVDMRSVSVAAENYVGFGGSFSQNERLSLGLVANYASSLNTNCKHYVGVVSFCSKALVLQSAIRQAEAF